MIIEEACKKFHDENVGKHGIFAVGIGSSELHVYTKSTPEGIPQEYEGFRVVAHLTEEPIPGSAPKPETPFTRLKDSIEDGVAFSKKDHKTVIMEDEEND